MDDKRAQTLQALSRYIEHQRALLARTHADIDRLVLLKRDVAAAREEVDVEQLRFSGQPLGAQCLESFVRPDIDWGSVPSRDAAAFKDLAAARAQPSRTQTSPLSDLQRLVKSARERILDPVLGQLPVLSDDDDDDDGVVTERGEVKRKRRGVGCGLRLRAPGRVYVRRDLEDESADVDIGGDGGGGSGLGGVRGGEARERRPPKRVREEGEAKTRQQNAKVEAPEAAPVESRPRPETYKLAWSVSEQHLLERLLEEIPDGERNRWQKISRGMNGRRTPRQVASRVQKYFEKLRRFGIDPDGKGGSFTL